LRALWPLLPVVALLCILFVAGLMLGAALGGISGPDPAGVREPPPSGSPGAAADSGVPQAAAEPISDRTSLTFVATYAECGCSTRQSSLAGAELGGLGREQLEERFPDWQIQTVTGSEVVFFRLLPGMCPEMGTYRTLGVRDGKVAVYLGRPGTGLLLQRLTSISVSNLPKPDRERLQAGIVLEGDRAVESYLEGLPE
jgi:hypothetical protein